VNRTHLRERLELLGAVGMIVGMVLGATIAVQDSRSRGSRGTILPRILSSDEPDRPEES